MNSGLKPLFISAYPDVEDRTYYPDRSKGVKGFSRVVVKWDPHDHSDYFWKTNQEYTIKYPGTYMLEAPPGFATLYKPIVHVDLWDFLDYLKQSWYSRVIDYPEKVEDPETHRVTWNYNFRVADSVDRGVSRFPDPPIDVPDPKTSDYVTTIENPVIQLPQVWSRSTLLVELADNAPIHSEDPYEGVLRTSGIDIFNHFSLEGIEVTFDGEPYVHETLTGIERWTPSVRSTDGVWRGFKCEIRSVDLLYRDSRFVQVEDVDVVVLPGTGLVNVYRDDDVIVVAMHWNPVNSSSWTVHIDRGFVYNGYSCIVGSRAELRLGARSNSNTVATFVPVDVRGTCTLLLSPDRVLLSEDQ